MNKRFRILYIDDSRFDRELVRDALRRRDDEFELFEASTRIEFEALFKQRDYDLILSDFNIAGYLGLDVIDHVRSLDAHMPVLIVTGTGSEEVAVEAMKRGAVDYVIKTPYHIRRLPQTIQAAIELNQMRIEHQRLDVAMRRISRARKVMADCNHAVVHAQAEATLLQEMCDIVVESGGYPMAWIGYVPDGDTGMTGLTPMAYAGNRDADQNVASALKAAGCDETDSATRAVITGKVQIARDVLTESPAGIWRDFAKEHSIVCATSLPLRDASRVFGALTIYENELHEIDPEQIALFTGLAEDIAYGVISLRTKLARELADQALLASEEKLAGILNSIDNVVWSASSTEFLYINPVVQKVYGRTVEDFYKNRHLWIESIHPLDRERVRASLEQLRSNGSLTHEYRIVRADGDIRWLEDRTKAVFDENGNMVRIDGVASDISERKKYEIHIEYLASHDALTGLANRTLLADRMTRAMVHARRSDKLLALLFLDLDRFKDVNDSFGHTLGDALLMAVAARLQGLIRGADTISRQGGDEFLILLTDLREADDVARIAAKLLSAFTSPFTIGGHKLYMTVSIGATVFPTDGTEIETLLQNADTAMYRAKDQGSNGFQFYSREMSLRAIHRVAMESALRLALEREEFELYYQPQISLETGEIIGSEALIRWHHPDNGMVPPDQFIPLAEDIGLIVPIGEWVLRTACAQNKKWEDLLHVPISVSVNLSARQFRQDRLVQTVQEVLEETGLEPGCLELELTESMVMNGPEEFIAKLDALKALGVQLSIDDFGTGYSSLSYLKRFSIDRLKIDRSFIRDLGTDPDDEAITISIIALGHSFKLKVIAEGVETEEQLALLRTYGCDEMQGYYFSKPIPAKEFEQLLRSKKSLGTVLPLNRFA